MLRSRMFRYLLVWIPFLLSVSLPAQRPRHVSGEVLVKLSPGLSASQWIKNSPEFQSSGFPIKPGKMISAPMNIHKIHFDHSEIDEAVLLELIRQNAWVEIAQFNHYVTLRSTVPNDPQYGQQWQYDNTGQSGGTPGADIDMDLAWDYTTGGLTAQGDTIVVCVIDDGISATHPDIAPNLWVNHAEIPNNGIDDDNNGFVDDYRGWDTGSSSDNVYDGGGHGTPVAGIVGAKGNNGIGVSGVNWDVKLMIVQGGTGVESEVLEAYSYPLVMRQKYNQSNGAEGAFVVATNASWGIDMGQPSNAPLWCAFYDTLGVHGILNAGATANAALDVDTQGDLPTACPSDYLISVTNMNHNDQKVNQAAWGLMHVDLGAFGAGTHTVNGFGGYSAFGGTSGATPHVAGTIGLLYAAPCPAFIALAKADPAAAALQIKQVILNGVDPNNSLTGITVTGGRLNVHNSMQLLMQSCGPCPAPQILAETNVTDIQATLNWISGDSALSNQLEWRELGDSVWTVVQGVDSSYTLMGLTPCTTYEYQFSSFCASDTSEFVSSGTFQTDGCCENPSDFSLDSLAENHALFGWSSVLAAQSYQIRIREVGGGWMSFLTSDTSYSFSTLLPCTQYEAEISVICVGDTVAFGQQTSFRTLGCGACIDLPYCAPPQLEAGDEWIASVLVHTLDNSSGSNNGYGDFTEDSLTTELEIGELYSFTLSPGFAGQGFTEYFKIWIDYNQDGDFDDLDEELYASGGTTTPVSDQFVVPNHALLGGTRMRISMFFDTPPNPCTPGIEPYGEVEDYCITILPEPAPCLAPADLDTLDVSNDGILIGWEADTMATGYVLRFRKMNDSLWTERVTTVDSILLENLDFCQSYEVQVKTFCGIEGSEFGAVDTFSTLCRTSIGNQLPTGSISVYPNPFSQALVVEVLQREPNESLVIEMFNPMGIRVYEQQLQHRSQGKHTIEIASQKLVPGVYWIRLRNQEGRSLTIPVVKSN